MQSPSSSKVPTQLAPQHLRLFSLLFDYLIGMAILKLLNQLFLGEHWDLSEGGGFMDYWYLEVGLLVLLKDAAKGQSPGKWLTGIAVRQAKDPANPPRFSALILRQVGLILLPIEAILVFTDSFCRRLGDRLAGTLVITHPTPPKLSRRLMGLTVMVMGGLMSAFLLTPWNMRQSAAYQQGYQLVQNNPGLEEKLGAAFEVDNNPDFSLGMRDNQSTAHLVFQVNGHEVPGKNDSEKGEEKQVEVEIFLSRQTYEKQWKLEKMGFIDRKQTKPKPPGLIQDAPQK